MVAAGGGGSGVSLIPESRAEGRTDDRVVTTEVWVRFARGGAPDIESPDESPSPLWSLVSSLSLGVSSK